MKGSAASTLLAAPGACHEPGAGVCDDTRDIEGRQPPAGRRTVRRAARRRRSAGRVRFSARTRRGSTRFTSRSSCAPRSRHWRPLASPGERRCEIALGCSRRVGHNRSMKPEPDLDISTKYAAALQGADVRAAVEARRASRQRTRRAFHVHRRGPSAPRRGALGGHRREVAGRRRRESSAIAARGRGRRVPRPGWDRRSLRRLVGAALHLDVVERRLDDLLEAAAVDLVVAHERRRVDADVELVGPVGGHLPVAAVVVEHRVP